jgi:hypothetical protein
MKETLQAVADAALQEPVIMDVDVKPQSRFFALLQKYGLKPKVRTLTIHPIVMGNLIRISKLLIDIDMTVFDLKQLLESNYQAMAKYGDHVVQVVAIAVHNGKSEPPRELVEFIRYNFTSHELLAVLGLVAKQMNVMSFMSSIISIKGMNVLTSQKEMSPISQGEIIAPGASLEE